MSGVLKYFLVGQFVLAWLPGLALAETSTPSTLTEARTENTSTRATDLRIPARAGAGFSTPGSGYEGTFNVESFIPLLQTPGEEITFLEARFYLDDDAHTGGNLMLGHRFYERDDNRIWGGYLAYDNRQTANNSFHQFGFGLESLGEVWDFHFNAYLPFGDRRQLDRDASFANVLNSSARFQGNLLLLDSLIERQRLLVYEAAAGGFDLEAGARLAHWEQGDLRGYGGIYFYDAPGSDSTFGWRLRLDADVNRSMNLGLALQGDRLFGTNLIFSVALTLPGIRPAGPIGAAEIVQARLGEPLLRNPNIVLDTQTEAERSVERNIMPLMNPEEEEAYRFFHVTLGATGGDGTFERPFGTVQEALNATLSDGNDVVYVDAGNRVSIPAFTIPDRVQVLSQGPVQLLGGLPFPGFPRTQVRLPFSPVLNYSDGILVQLPLSGDGNFPVIQGGGADLVQLGDRTVLAGFRLSGASGNAIVGNNIRDVELRDNRIENAGERGIFFNNVVGSVVMFDNQIGGSQGGVGSGQAILIQNGTDDAVEVTIARQRLDNQRVGIEVTALGDRLAGITPQQTVNISATSITNSQEQGIFLQANGPSNQQVAFRRGSIRNSGRQGLLVQANNTGSQEVVLEDSRLQANGSAGIQVIGGTLGGSTTAAQEVFIRRNWIENNGGAGIEIVGNEVVAQEFGISGNTIRNNAGPGIRAIANNEAFQEYVTDADNASLGINDNRISGNQGAGITLEANNAATLVADIQNNQLAANQTGGAPDLTVTSTSSNARVCTVLLGNRSATGIRLNNAGTTLPLGLFEVGDLPTVSFRNFGSVTLSPSAAAFTNKPGATSCFQ